MEFLWTPLKPLTKTVFFHWFIIAALAGQEITEEMRQEIKDITLTLNNQEIDVVRAINRLEEKVDRRIKESAMELANKQIEATIFPIREELDKIEETMRSRVSNSLALE